MILSTPPKPGPIKPSAGGHCAAAGDTVTVTLGGNTYTTTVQGNLSWSISVPAADLRALGNGDLTINASVTNANGNTGSGTRDITIDANLRGCAWIR